MNTCLDWIRFGRAAVWAALLLISQGCAKPPASETSCEVYRAFYTFWAEGGDRTIYFRATTRALPLSQWGRLVNPPHSFARDSDEMTTVETDNGPEQISIQEDFDADVSRYILPTAIGGQNLRACFPDNTDAPHLYVGMRELVYRRERDALSAGTLSLVQLSPVGVSPDGSRALIYADYSCGVGLCGGGSFYLFERHGGVWRVAGTDWAWVS